MRLIEPKHEEIRGLLCVDIPIGLPSPRSGEEQGAIAREAVAAALEAHPFASATSVSYWVMFVRLGPKPMELGRVIPTFVPIWEGTLEALALTPDRNLLCTYSQRRNELWGVRIEIQRLRARAVA